MIPQIRTINNLSDDQDGVAKSQTPVGAGDLSLDGALVSGGIAIIGEAQLITITAAADETARTFTISGTNADGNTISESIAGPNATTGNSSKYFKTVTQISVDGATTGAVEVGPIAANGAVSKTIPVNWRQIEFQIAMAVIVTGTLTYTVQHTLDDVQDLSIEHTYLDNSGLTGKTSNDDGNLAFPVKAVRLQLTAFTSPASATITLLQAS